MPSIYNTMPELRGEAGKIALITLATIVVVAYLMKLYNSTNAMIIKARIYKIEKVDDSLALYYSYSFDKIPCTGKELIIYQRLNEDSLLATEVDLRYSKDNPKSATLLLGN